MTVNMMEQSMDEAELYKWSLYLDDETPDVPELQNAILSNMIARYMGSKNSKYEDFLIRGKKKEAASTLMSADAIKAAFKSMVVE